MKHTFLFLLLFFVCDTLRAQDSPSTLLYLGEQAVSVGQFDYLYGKNHRDSADQYSRESLEAYLPLFINFKRKVLEAKALGLDKDPLFQQEFDSYRRQLARPYLTDQGSVQALVEEAKKRRQTEVRASHLLIRLAPEADTAAAYRQLLALRQRVLNGENFEQLARQYSEDPSAKVNAGDLGYFTALQMVYPFENAAYKLEIDEVSEPVRTSFGYHLVRVTDKRPARGTVQVAHIMIGFRQNIEDEQEENVQKTIEELYRQLVADTSRWNALCQQFSVDANTRQSGGVLPPFSVGQMPPSFSEAAFALQAPGQLSEPVRTQAGWHILKLIEKKPLPPFEEVEQEFMQRIRQDARAEARRMQFVERMKQAHGYRESPEGSAWVLTAFDARLLGGTWTFTPDAQWKKTLFSVGGNDVTAEDFLKFAEIQQQARPGNAHEEYARSLLNLFTERKILEAEETVLPEKYPEYAYLLQEYYEGMLFFEVMQQKVWQPANDDTAGLSAFFAQHRDRYQWKQRVRAARVCPRTHSPPPSTRAYLPFLPKLWRNLGTSAPC